MVKHMERIIMHIDVNNAFLSWSAIYYLEKGSKIDIRNTYAVIGGDETKRKGVVLAKSNFAKKKGVVTGESLYMARKKCPQLKTYPMNYPFYKKMSNKMFTLIKKYTPDIEIASIDECYLDYTSVHKLYGDPFTFAKKLQKEINETLKFTINIGIANNKLCAKMASDFSKPNKIHTLFKEEVQEKMWILPVEDLFGVGKKTASKLHALQIYTISDLATSDVLKLYPYFKNQAQCLINSANGIDDSIVDSSEIENKGISSEITLDQDINDYRMLDKYLLMLSEKVSARLRKEEKYAYTVTVILKDNSFKKRTHQKQLSSSTNSSKEIFLLSKTILKEMWQEEEIRLIGIRLNQLTTECTKQISLFHQEIIEDKKEEALEKVVDSLKSKYGNAIIKKGGEN